MEAKELMINDWTQDSEGAFQISDLGKRAICLDTNSKVRGCNEPIPLTEEILNANGFMDVDGGLLRLDIPEGYICYANSILIIYVKKKMNLELRNIKNYVHELQHALRLCGLNDLADNFKLK